MYCREERIPAGTRLLAAQAHPLCFESILEGLYGPGLRRDLSLFDDCEPEELTDWCVDEKCSFCNLRKETVSDQTHLGFLQSTAGEEPLSQGQYNTEKIECQAESYLNALFQKKDLPQNCDSNIPLVAQEIMKKMIRQFAIEYVSKLQENKNGSSSESNSSCNGIRMNLMQIPLQEEQDGPLDLTVNRTHEQISQQGDGVLDLSTKKTNLRTETPNAYDLSGNSSSNSTVCAKIMLPSDEISKLDKRTTTLSKILDSLCRYHRQQILNMLIFLTHELNACTSFCNSWKLPHVSLESQKSLHEEKDGMLCSSIEHRHTRRCRLQYLKPSSLRPTFVGIKDAHSSLCSFQPVKSRGVCEASQNVISMNDSGRSRSPSPPPLSPVWTDHIEHLESISDYATFETNKFELNNNQPPSLLPAEGNRLLQICKRDRYRDSIGISLSTEQMHKSVNSKKCVKSQSTSVFEDLMDRINEKLKSIETSDIETNSEKLTSFENRKTNNTKFGDLIKSLVQNAKANDYSFKELLNQHEKSMENKIIQTRFRKRQETLLAMHNSPDSSLSRRKSLQIKRELVCLNDPYVRKKSACKGSRRNYINVQESTPEKSKNKERGNMPEEIIMPDINNQEAPMHQSACETQLLELSQHSFEPHFDRITCNHVTPNYLNLTTAQGENISDKQDNIQNHLDSLRLGENESALKVDYSGILGRTKDDILTPGWYSVYVTNDFLKKSARAKLSSESLVKNKIVLDKVKSLGDTDVNKIAKNTSLQVVVERLEDALHLAKTMFQKHSLMQRFKIPSKLKENEHKCNRKQNPNKKLCYETNSLPKSHVPCSSADKMDGVPSNLLDVTEQEFDCPTNSSVWNSNNLVPVSKERETKSEVSNGPSSYYSPIKLMFVSEVNCKEGVRYTLSSISVASKGNPSDCICEKSSECLINKTGKIEDKENSQDVFSDGCLGTSSETISAEKETKLNNILDVSNMNETEKYCLKNIAKTVDRLSNVDDSTLKRKPGSPKKIGPQVMKQIKRPIGRPPKAKINGNESICGKGESRSGKSAESVYSRLEENCKKNLIITVVFGRSRRIQRHVSEGMHVLNICANLKHNEEKKLDEANTCSVGNPNTKNKVLKSSYECIRPIEDKPVLPYSRSNIIHPSKKPVSAVRKPGRLAKIKISGISVTVSSVSPQERKVSMNSCLPPLTQSILEKTISKHDNQQCSIRSTMQDNFSQNSLDFESMETKMDSPRLRHSIREKQPSLPFLHSLESVNMFAYKNALVHKSHKLCSNKAKDRKDKTKHITLSRALKHTSDSRNAKKDCEERYNSIFEISSEPIFSSNTSLRWWATTVSNNLLLEDLDSRFEQITNTWLQIDGNEPKSYLYSKGNNDEQDCTLEISNPLRTCLLEYKISPVKMLFKKKCDMNKLCTWFMETTETQSLSITRKANARNPLDVISSKRIKARAKHSDLNSSPFSKHLKKFALSSPSQSVEKLQMLHGVVRPGCCNFKSKIALAGVKTKFIKLKQEKWRVHHELCNHLAEWAPQHRNVKYKYNHALKKMNNIVATFQGHRTNENQQHILPAETEIANDIHQKVQLLDFRTHANKHKEENDINRTQKCGRTQDQSKFYQSTYKPETFKDCRVCLKKINYAEKKNSWKLNSAHPSASSEFCSNLQAHIGISCILRSHAAQKDIFKEEKKMKTDKGPERHHNENISNKAHISSTKWLEEQMKRNKIDLYRKSNHSFTSVSKVLHKKNEKKRPGTPLENDLKISKRPKRQSGSKGHMTSYYSNFQLAHHN